MLYGNSKMIFKITFLQYSCTIKKKNFYRIISFLKSLDKTENKICCLKTSEQQFKNLQKLYK